MAAVVMSPPDSREGEAATVFVHLHGSRALIEARMQARQGHFMPLGLIDSQFLQADRIDRFLALSLQQLDIGLGAFVVVVAAMGVGRAGDQGAAACHGQQGREKQRGERFDDAIP